MVWDHDGARYGVGPGLHVWVNGKLAASSPRLMRLEVSL